MNAQVIFGSSASSPGTWKGGLWLLLDILFRMILWIFLGRKPNDATKDVELGDGDDDMDDDDDSDCDDCEADICGKES